MNILRVLQLNTCIEGLETQEAAGSGVADSIVSHLS